MTQTNCRTGSQWSTAQAWPYQDWSLRVMFKYEVEDGWQELLKPKSPSKGVKAYESKI